VAEETKRLTLRDYAKEPVYFASGHRLCAGCGAGTMARQVTMAFDKPTFVVNATGCLEVASTIYPFTAWKCNWLHVAFENAGAVASGIEAAFKVLVEKKQVPFEEFDVVAFAGDGGTYDIGIQALSGAVERGHDLLYICYNNGAYMNTGIQRSGGTPRAAHTTTSPGGSVHPGKDQMQKDLVQILVGHDIPFAATTTPAYPLDLIRKTREGLDVKGPAFLLVDSPCPLGQRFAGSQSLAISRMAVETCFFPLYKVICGEYQLSAQSQKIARNPDLKKPVEEYMKLQGRFRHVFRHPNGQKIIQEIQAHVDRKWNRILRMCEL